MHPTIQNITNKTPWFQMARFASARLLRVVVGVCLPPLPQHWSRDPFGWSPLFTQWFRGILENKKPHLLWKILYYTWVTWFHVQWPKFVRKTVCRNIGMQWSIWNRSRKNFVTLWACHSGVTEKSHIFYLKDYYFKSFFQKNNIFCFLIFFIKLSLRKMIF